MATYWENSCSFGLRYVSWYKYLIVSLFFSHLGFWSGNLFLIAPFPDLCLLVPSYDLIRNEMLKTAKQYICKPVTQAFNAIFNSGKFPKSWKDGIIIPVHKQGNKLDVNNYRGITISSCLGKLFCHIINDRNC